MNERALFRQLGEALAADPNLQLKPISLPPFKPDVGPYLRVQFVIELVGRSLVPREIAMQLLDSRAKSSLGNPEVYVMAPDDKRWKTLWAGDESLAYDSLSLAWDLLSGSSSLSKTSAVALLERAEHFASSIERKAVPLRDPADIDSAVANLRNIKDSLDVGIDIAIDPVVDSFRAEAVIREAYKIGFRLQDSGLLELRQPGWPEALLTVYPLGKLSEFDLALSPELPTYGMGFTVPTSPNPPAVLEALFEASDKLSAACGGVVRDDNGEVLDEAARSEMRSTLQEVVATFQRIGLPAGSPEALRLFEA